MSVATGSAAAGDGEAQAAFATTLVDEWFRAGVRHAVVCPGSSSHPVALALVDHGGIAVYVRLDERSAAFTALGIGLATGLPAVVLTTSGTAAAELHAAVVEADLARVPLVVSPPTGLPSCARWGPPRPSTSTGCSAPPCVGSPTRAWPTPSTAGMAVAGGPVGGRDHRRARGPGPVHLNLPFREPLLGVPGPGQVPDGRPHGAPWHRVAVPGAPPPTEVVDRLAEAGATGARGLVVVGAGGGEHGAVSALADALGWPVLADPRSGLRPVPGG